MENKKQCIFKTWRNRPAGLERLAVLKPKCCEKWKVWGVYRQIRKKKREREA